MKNYDYSPLHEKLGDGEVSFVIGVYVKSDMDTVWNNVCKAENVKKYFTTDARRDLNRGGEVLWAWGDEAALINVTEVIPKEKIVFEWNGYQVSYRVTTQFTFEEKGNRILVKIKESGWNLDKEGTASAFANCNGWSDFLNALKVHTEHGIDYLK